MSQADSAHTTTLSRRTILAAGTALAVTASAVTTAAIAASPETTIQALGRQWAELCRKREVAHRLLSEAHDRFQAMRPPIPEEIRVTDHFARMDLKREPGCHLIEPVEWAEPDCRPFGKASGFRHLVERPVKMLDGKTIYKQRYEWAKKCLPIAEAYEAAQAEAYRASGYEAIEEAADLLDVEFWALERRLLSERATCVADLLIQAEVFEKANEGLVPDDNDMVVDLLRSIKGLANIA
jgi:hypothetical protein